MRSIGRVLAKWAAIVLIAECVLRVTGFLFLSYYVRWGKPSIDIREDTFRLLFIGESTTAGGGLEDEREAAGPYPEQLEKVLNAAHGPVKYECINMGIAGITSSHFRRVFKKLLLDYRPQVVVMHLGHNANPPSLLKLIGVGLKSESFQGWRYILIRTVRDLRVYKLMNVVYEAFLRRFSAEQIIDRHHFNSSEELFYLEMLESKADIRSMIHEAVSQGSRVVLCNYFQSDANPVIRELSNEFDMALCDNEGVFKRLESQNGVKELISEDGWHPSGKGQSLITMNLYKILMENKLVPTEAPFPAHLQDRTYDR